MSPQTLRDQLVTLFRKGSIWKVTRPVRGGDDEITIRTVVGIYANGDELDHIVWRYGKPCVIYDSALPEEHEIKVVLPGLIHWQYDWGVGIELLCVPYNQQKELL